MITEKKRGKIEIGLTGPDGNVFVLIGIASRLAKETGKDSTTIINDMKSDDYEHAVSVLEKEFGDLIIIYR
jgi:hypothetical protein